MCRYVFVCVCVRVCVCREWVRYRADLHCCPLRATRLLSGSSLTCTGRLCSIGNEPPGPWFGVRRVSLCSQLAPPSWEGCPEGCPGPGPQRPLPSAECLGMWSWPCEDRVRSWLRRLRSRDSTMASKPEATREGGTESCSQPQVEPGLLELGLAASTTAGQ